MDDFFPIKAAVINNTHIAKNSQNHSIPSDRKDKKEHINHLKEKIYSSRNFIFKDKSCCFDENFLSRFLYSCKFNIESAFCLLMTYLEYKSQHEILFKRINIFDEQIQKAVRSGNPTVLRQRDRKGRKIIYFSISQWDVNEYNLTDVYRALLLTLDLLLDNEENQALGFIVIVDWLGLSFTQSKYLTPKLLRLIIEGLQNAMPVKFKGIHFLSQTWYVETVFSLIKPLLKEKTRKRLVFHGTNLTTLHNFIHKSVLPTELGGAGTSINNLDWFHYVVECSQNLESCHSYKIIEPVNYIKINHRNTIINLNI